MFRNYPSSQKTHKLFIRQNGRQVNKKLAYLVAIMMAPDALLIVENLNKLFTRNGLLSIYTHPPPIFLPRMETHFLH